MNSSQNVELVKLRVELDKVTPQFQEVYETLQFEVYETFVNKKFLGIIPSEVNSSHE